MSTQLAPLTVQVMIAEVRARAQVSNDQTTLDLCDKAAAGQTVAKSKVLEHWRRLNA